MIIDLSMWNAIPLWIHVLNIALLIGCLIAVGAGLVDLLSWWFGK